MLSLLLILSGLAWLTSAHQGSETSFLQITVPEKIQTNTKHGDVSERKVTYIINIEGKTYTLLLEKQSFLYSHFPVYAYSQSGTLQQESLHTQDHCFYQGHVKKILKSAVTLNICSGLRGFLLLENTSYGIEPLESSTIFEHMIYQINNDKIDYFPLTESYPQPQYVGSFYKILVTSEKNSNVVPMKTTLKIQIIIDKAMFDYVGSKMDIAAQKVIHVFGLINTIFSHLQMTVMLSSLEVWSDKNKISTKGNADEVLQRFMSWKQKFLSQRSNDLAYLLIYNDHPNFVGATYHGIACDPKFAAGIILYPKTISLEAFSVVLAQLLGINLGLTYDDIYNCYCPGSTCIMYPGAIRSSGVKLFSSCSIEGFMKILSQPKFECLQNKTVSNVVLQPKAGACGDGVLDNSEQCDCGQPEVCKHKKCCDPTSCMLKNPSFECGSGTCCDANTCTVIARGFLCRKSTDPCDFPEYCNGISEFCMPDMKAANLEPCFNGTAYCLDGICRDPSRQCVELFGKFSKNAPYLCTEEVNFLNDKFGNCGKVCDFKFILCGKLVCHWAKAELANMRDYDLQYTYLSGHICVSAHLRNTSRKDDTFVSDGTVCGEEKVCQNKSCILREEHKKKANCNSKQKCGGHGVCNTKLNCHCDAGYAPPDCEEAMSSPGGSVDDGYWLSSDKAKLLIAKQHATQKKNNGLLISFFFFLTFLVVTAIVVLKRNKIKGFLQKEETVSGGSTTEDSGSNSFQS